MGELKGGQFRSSGGFWYCDCPEIVIFLHDTLIACSFETYAAHRRSEDAARAAVHECSGTVYSRKAQCQAPPDNPETGDTYHSTERSCAGEKIEHQNVYKRNSQHPPPRRLPPTRQQHNYWVEPARVSLLGVVAAAAACCSYSHSENPPSLNEARDIRREGRRAISAKLAGTGWCMYLLAACMAPMRKHPTCSNGSS